MQECTRKSGFSRFKPEQDKVRKAPNVSVTEPFASLSGGLTCYEMGGGIAAKSGKRGCRSVAGFCLSQNQGAIFAGPKNEGPRMRALMFVNLVGRIGFEPMTTALKVQCSTD
jgi:hypothetical protein